MNQINVKELIIKVYSNLIEENIHSWLKAEEALKASKMTPKENLNLREKVRNISSKISSDFADIVILKGFPSKDISRDETKEIIKKLIEKYRRKINNEKNAD